MEIEIEPTMQRLLAQEDTDGDDKITIHDRGPRYFTFDALDGTRHTVYGTYALSSFLQELALAREGGEAILRLDPQRLNEPPTQRIARLIRTTYWDGLTRSMDEAGLARMERDPKMALADSVFTPRLYVPATDPEALAYYQRVAAACPEFELDVIRLPIQITPDYVFGLNHRPGMVALAYDREEDGTLRPLPFIVPGGRFNEMYGWDSYFIILGLLASGRIEQARDQVEHLLYQLRHYGYILNANRSYYLIRSNPPFLTAIAWAVFEHLPDTGESRAWFARVLRAAIYEYHRVWTSGDRRTHTGLSRHVTGGIGMPPEVEESHYDAVLLPYAQEYGLPLREFKRLIAERELVLPDLDHYFMHDRAVRESGHDTSYRLEYRAANLNTVDLNSLLFRYETDLAHAIDTVFDGHLPLADGSDERSDVWYHRAMKRQTLLINLCWDNERKQFFDYAFNDQHHTGYESATTFYPLWAGLATPQQAEALVQYALPRFTERGGLVASTLQARGKLAPDRPQRQWDYPLGWAPHQMLLWTGLRRYGYDDVANDMAFRWLRMVTQNAAAFNGTITEKYDVVRGRHDVLAEYGNEGLRFKYVPTEGFGWTNASYLVGLDLMQRGQRIDLDDLTPED